MKLCVTCSLPPTAGSGLSQQWRRCLSFDFSLDSTGMTSRVYGCWSFPKVVYKSLFTSILVSHCRAQIFWRELFVLSIEVVMLTSNIFVCIVTFMLSEMLGIALRSVTHSSKVFRLLAH